MKNTRSFQIAGGIKRSVSSKLPGGKEVTIILILSLIGGIFGITYATVSGTLGISPDAQTASSIATVSTNFDNGPGGGVRPSWPDNIVGGTGGTIENGDLFRIEPDPAFNNGFWIEVELVNRNEINQKYTSFTENLGIYYWDSGTWTELPENAVVTRSGPSATFQITSDHANDNIVITLENGYFYAKEGYGEYPGPINHVNIDEAAY